MCSVSVQIGKGLAQIIKIPKSVFLCKTTEGGAFVFIQSRFSLIVEQTKIT
jgi:hypothetical protein